MERKYGRITGRVDGETNTPNASIHGDTSISLRIKHKYYHLHNINFGWMSNYVWTAPLLINVYRASYFESINNVAFRRVRIMR